MSCMWIGVASLHLFSCPAGSQAWKLLGNLYELMPLPLAGVTLVICAMVCGTLIGLERRAHDKPAGRRTMALICVGSAIFTLTSMVVAGGADPGDPGRIAAQVVTGIGFLGAGAIIREGTTVIGLTTAATIWVVAAIGILIGAGYAAGGLALTFLVLGMLILLRHNEKAGKNEE